MRRFLTYLALFLAALPAAAQEQPMPRQMQHVPVLVKISAGTGFFVNKEGDLVTNAHVVRNCQRISVLTPAGERNATLRATDPKNDLAVLRVAGDVPEIALLRWNIRDLKQGDEVIVMGYPGQEGVAGQYRFKKSRVLSLSGPISQPFWLQLESVAEHGNSGGPVLDGTGNVIAVVAGNAITYRVMTSRETGQRLSEPEQIGKSDVAITLPVLEDFLRSNGTGFYQSSSGSALLPDAIIERRANRFILPVRCFLGPQA